MSNSLSSRLSGFGRWLASSEARKLLLVFAVLYFFLVGIGAMGAGFKLMGKEVADGILGIGAESGPLVSLFIGILATTLVQSSSTTTSLIVASVASGVIPFDSAIYMVMGANVGTTVTNTIVSLGHITRSAEYQRAFAAATVHDFFNLIVLVVIFPLEVYTGFLTHMADWCAASFEGMGATKVGSPIKAITKPVISVMLDALNGIDSLFGSDVVEAGTEQAAEQAKKPKTPFHVAAILAGIGVVMTFVALFALVRTLRSLMISRIENLFDRTVFRNSVFALIFGFLLTILVQSSSITTSVIVPLVGAGVLSIRQIFPYTMGANVGTTITALIAALAMYATAQAVDPANPTAEEAKSMVLADNGLRLAFHHVLFNVVGVALVWPIRGVPIWMAEQFARLAMWNRAIPLVYIVFTFYLLPFLVIYFGR